MSHLRGRVWALEREARACTRRRRRGSGWEFANQPDLDPQFEGLSDTDVEQHLRDGASRIAAMQCRWLLLLAELGVRGRWADGGGARTPGQWSSWAGGEAAPTAREHVRVAVPEIEQRLLDLADSAPASVLSHVLAKSR